MQPTCNIAFKEWAAVCEALAAGRQTILLRKGGLGDEPHEFRNAAHQGFWLYPTNFHQRVEELRSDAGEFIDRTAASAPPVGQIHVRLYAEILWIDGLTDENAALRLADWHILSEAMVRKRFAYREPGLFLLGVRVFKRGEAVVVTESAEMAGCRSWVRLPEPISKQGLEPVLSMPQLVDMGKAIWAALA
jgi:hypothetical protein